MSRRRAALIPVLALCAFLAACSSSDDGDPTTPTGPAPLPVADLAVTAGADGQLTLRWTSPALPAKAGGTIAYALRHTAPGGEDDPWEAWTALPAPAADDEAGILREHTVTGLEAGRTYALRLRARWGQGPWSDVSNPVIATAAADHDRTRPAPVVGLRQWAADRTWLTVAWATGCDDSVYGTAAGYEVRWSTAPIDEANWAAAPLHEGAVTPATKPGYLQTTITDLADSTDHWVAVRAIDDAGLRSGLGVPVACLTDSMRIWYVNVEGTGDVPTIGAAVAAARVGDTVLVAPGRYTWTNQGTGDPHFGLVYVPAYHT
ncbi:MAG: fibronectin type III domain-containing protein, partial [Candidatus Krumholzibacteriia bacterium]